MWKLSASDEEDLSSVLPVESVVETRRQPWILHLLEVNALNFCAFAACARRPDGTLFGHDASLELLLAVPNALASEAVSRLEKVLSVLKLTESRKVDVFALPGQSRLHTVRPSSSTTGLVMSLRLLHLVGCLTLIAGFENGSVSVRRLEAEGAWITTYSSQPHSQPILSLDIHPNHESFFSSSADSMLVQHPVPTAQLFCSADAEASQGGDMEPWKHPLQTVNTKHFGQQSLNVRSDGKIFATAGWDSKVRVYSTKTLNELAVLQWHRVGAYAVAFADVFQADTQSYGQRESPLVNSSDESTSTSVAASETRTSLVGRELTTVKQRRMRAALTTHWIAAGAKDGKVSLWQVY